MNCTRTLLIKRPELKPDYLFTVNDEKLTECLLELYSPFAGFVTEAVHDEPELHRITINKSPEKNEYIVKVNNEPLYIVDSYNILQEIQNRIYSSTDISENYIALHASAVGMENKAYLLTGETKAGKSTLTAWLCNNNFTYLTDDVSLIDLRDIMVHPNHNNIMLREGGKDILKKYMIDLSGCKKIEWGRIQRYSYRPAVLQKNPCQMGGIFFISRSEQENSVKALNRKEAFLKLLKSAYLYRSLGGGYYQLLAKIINIGCYNIIYRDFEYVKNIILEI